MMTIACSLMSGHGQGHGQGHTSACYKAGSGVGFSFGVGAWTEMEIQCVKGMYRLKPVSNEKIQGLKG